MTAFITGVGAAYRHDWRSAFEADDICLGRCPRCRFGRARIQYPSGPGGESLRIFTMIPDLLQIYYVAHGILL